MVPDLLFLQVPDDKVGRTVSTSTCGPTTGRPGARSPARGLGATRSTSARATRELAVMADPEGNEFCVLPAYPPEVRAQWRIQYDAYQRLD